MKKISVVMCTYNGERFLREQLDSLVHQTYPLHEIIVQDDGSTDATLAILGEYASQWKHIRLLKNEGPHGVNSNFWSAMRKATGDWIAICDQDDIWEPDKIERQAEAIGNSMFCAGRTRQFSEDGSFVFYDARRPNVSLLRMLYTTEIGGHVMLFRKDFLQQLPVDCGIYHHTCYDMVLAVAAAAYDSLVYMDTILVHQRRYAGATTYSSGEKSLPTVGNGMRMLWWCLQHYREVKRLSDDFYGYWEDFLQLLPVDTAAKREGLALLDWQRSSGVFRLIGFQWFCLRHRFQLFHTRGKDPQNILRALLFPIMATYYRRSLILPSR